MIKRKTLWASVKWHDSPVVWAIFPFQRPATCYYYRLKRVIASRRFVIFLFLLLCLDVVITLYHFNGCRRPVKLFITFCRHQNWRANDTHFRRATLNKQQQQKKEEEKKKEILKRKIYRLEQPICLDMSCRYFHIFILFFFPFFNEAASHQTLVADGTVSVRRQ